MKYFSLIKAVAIFLAGSVTLNGGPAHGSQRYHNKANACDVAKKYIDLTEAKRYDEVGELWAEDAVFFNPAGNIIRGRSAITQFYAQFLRQIKPINRIASLAWDRKANVCVMELETRVIMGPDGRWVPDPAGEFIPTAIDRFEVNHEGKVQQMRVYLPPANAWQGQ